MGNKKDKILMGLVGVGLITLLSNIKNIEYTSFFGNDITISYKTLIDKGLLPQSSAGYALKWQQSGNLAVLGIVIMIVAVVMIIVNKNKQKKIEQSKQQNQIS